MIRADGATELYTSYVPGDRGPWPFYEKLGFVPTGEMDEDEIVIRRPAWSATVSRHPSAVGRDATVASLAHDARGSMPRRPSPRSALAFLQAGLLVAACGASSPSTGSRVTRGSVPAAPSAAPTPDVLAGLELPSPERPDDCRGRGRGGGVRRLTSAPRPGSATSIGSLADEVFAAIAAARTTAGETRLPEIAQALGIDLTTASIHVAAGAGAPGSGRPPANEWTGSVVGHATYTVTMMTGMLSGAIANAGVDQPRTTQTVEDHFDTTTGGVHEVVDIKTTYTLQTGGGRMFGEIKLETIAVGTDATTGAGLGTILGSATGSIDVSACPDEGGVAEGSLTLALQEGLTTSTGPGAGSSHAVDAPFRLIDGDDAHLVRTELDASIEAGAHGPGTAGGEPGAPFDWSMNGFVPISLEKGGGISIDPSRVTTSSNDAAERDVAGAINHAVVGTVMVAREIGREAEKFWRSGQCIDLKSSEESRKVSPDEKIEISVDPVHTFDGGSVKAPVTASFEGTKTLEPANTPVDPPASFDYLAGHDPGEKGTVSLTQTGARAESARRRSSSRFRPTSSSCRSAPRRRSARPRASRAPASSRSRRR